MAMMFRITLPRGVCALALLGLMGCAHLVESQAIEDFTAALSEKNYEGLRSATSPKFEQRALRTAEALDDFQILNLPKGETTIVEVQEASETEKLVTVNAGKMKKKLFYRLVREGEGENWVVDDVYVRKRKGGVKVDKSVAEQMDLLLNVREFLTVWHEGTREEVLGVATPELAAVLEDLPPMHLSRLCKLVVSEHVNDKRHRPSAQLDSDVAVVKLPRKTGKMMLSFKLMDGHWRVNDVAVESKRDQEHIPSVKKTAKVIRAAVQFLDAYNAGDKDRLKTVCHPKFYESSIQPGVLSTVTLPDQFISQGLYHVKMQGTQADFVIEEPEQVVKIGLSSERKDDSLEKKTVYRIDDVTIYPGSTTDDDLQEMRLSMVFTGHAVLQLFRESLAEGNLPLLRKIATKDFNRRVWHRIDEDAMAEFTPRIMTNRVEETLSSKYDGAMSRLTVQQMGRPVTYVLRDRKGRVAVDDVLLEEDETVASMKETMELMIPLRVFREALADSDMETLKRTSSAELNRMIWQQTDGVPPAGRTAVKHLLAPLNQVEHLDEGRALVTLGNRSFGCSVLLVTEHDKQVVDDIVVIDGAQPELRARLKHKLREQIAIGSPAAEETTSPVMHAGGWKDALQNDDAQNDAPDKTASQPRSEPKVKSADFAEFEEVAPLPEPSQAPVPLPERDSTDSHSQKPRTVPIEESEPKDSRETTSAPPLFPGGEADFEKRVPEIKPSENAFESP